MDFSSYASLWIYGVTAGAAVVAALTVLFTGSVGLSALAALVVFGVGTILAGLHLSQVRADIDDDGSSTLVGPGAELQIDDDEGLSAGELLEREGIDDTEGDSEGTAGGGTPVTTVCPKCGAAFSLGGLRFCPSCGAPMGPGPRHA